MRLPRYFIAFLLLCCCSRAFGQRFNPSYGQPIIVLTKTNPWLMVNTRSHTASLFRTFGKAMRSVSSLTIVPSKTLFLLGLVIIVILSAIGINSAFSSSKKTIYVTTLGNLSSAYAQRTSAQIKAFYGIDTKLLPAAALPSGAYCTVRQRYAAIRILRQLIERTPNSSKILALTNKDVEDESNGKHWGIMGLAYLGGDQAVVSTFRARTASRLSKVTLHEVGHMLAIPHCTSKTPACLMNDANGKGSTVDRTRLFLCRSCRVKMKF